MSRKAFFHLCANGAEVRNFIICSADYAAAFNLIGVCAANTDVRVVSFSLEDTHPHILLFGVYEDCVAFKLLFERLYSHYVAATRKTGHALRLPLGHGHDGPSSTPGVYPFPMSGWSATASSFRKTISISGSLKGSIRHSIDSGSICPAPKNAKKRCCPRCPKNGESPWKIRKPARSVAISANRSTAFVIRVD